MSSTSMSDLKLALNELILIAVLLQERNLSIVDSVRFVKDHKFKACHKNSEKNVEMSETRLCE